MKYWRKERGGFARTVLMALGLFTLLATVLADEHDHIVSVLLVRLINSNEQPVQRRR